MRMTLSVVSPFRLPPPVLRSGHRRRRGLRARAAAVGLRAGAGLGLAAMTGRAVDHGVVGGDGLDLLQVVVNAHGHAKHIARRLLRLLVVFLPLADDVAVVAANAERARDR